MLNHDIDRSAFVKKPETLGNMAFKKAYRLRLAYVAGAMYKGIASSQLVIKMASAGMLAFFGTGGLNRQRIEQAIDDIQAQVQPDAPYGMNLLFNLARPNADAELVDLYLRKKVRNIEASAYLKVTPALVYFRLAGLTRDKSGDLVSEHRVMAKVSRPEVAQQFLSPPDPNIVAQLLAQNLITTEQAEWSQRVAVATDLTVESDSGGHTDGAVANVLLPAMKRLRDKHVSEYGYEHSVFLGAAGGIGTPESAAAAFMLGADYIVTGSINQCTPEAGTSDLVKSMLQAADVQDTEYVPAGDMFELGATVQVLKAGVFFPSRANKLLALYHQYSGIEALDDKILQQLEKNYFGRSIASVWEETRAFYQQSDLHTLRKAEQSPKQKMALIFRWYFIHTTRVALAGEQQHKVNFQIQSGPAMGALNQWLKGTDLEQWQNRTTVKLAEKIMQGAAEVLTRYFVKEFSYSSSKPHLTHVNIPW